jgi:hypothetical protein
VGSQLDVLPICRAYQDAFNRHDLPGLMSLFTEDAVDLGSGDCKGAPCVGKKEIADHDTRETLQSKFIEESFSVVWVKGNKVEVAWSGRPNTGHIRGFFTFTLRDGKIARSINRYDLTDPETVLFRTGQGETGFGLRDPSVTQLSAARVLMSPLGKPIWTATAITVYLNDAVKDTAGLATRIHRGTCAELGEVVYELHPFADGRSDTRLEVKPDVLRSGGMSLAVSTTGDRVVLCGEIPFVPPFAPPPA